MKKLAVIVSKKAFSHVCKHLRLNQNREYKTEFETAYGVSLQTFATLFANFSFFLYFVQEK
jgi:hypothetical protein